MTTRHTAKLVHEGKYVAEVDVELIDSDTGWSPYLSLDDACRLDDVRATHFVAVTSRRLTLLPVSLS